MTDNHRLANEVQLVQTQDRAFRRSIEHYERSHAYSPSSRTFRLHRMVSLAFFNRYVELIDGNY